MGVQILRIRRIHELITSRAKRYCDVIWALIRLKAPTTPLFSSCFGLRQRKHQSFAILSLCAGGICQWTVAFPHKCQIMRKMCYLNITKLNVTAVTFLKQRFLQEKCSSFGSDNGWRQAIIWTNDSNFTDAYMRHSDSISELLLNHMKIRGMTRGMEDKKIRFV